MFSLCDAVSFPCEKNRSTFPFDLLQPWSSPEVYLFRFLPPEQLSTLVRSLEWKPVGRGDFLYREGERAEPAPVHVLVSGRVQLYRGDDAVASKQAVDLVGDTAHTDGRWAESALVTTARAEVRGGVSRALHSG